MGRSELLIAQVTLEFLDSRMGSFVLSEILLAEEGFTALIAPERETLCEPPTVLPKL